MAITETADYILTGTTGVFRSFKDFDAAVQAARTSHRRLNTIGGIGSITGRGRHNG